MRAPLGNAVIFGDPYIRATKGESFNSITSTTAQISKGVIVIFHFAIFPGHFLVRQSSRRRWRPFHEPCEWQ